MSRSPPKDDATKYLSYLEQSIQGGKKNQDETRKREQCTSTYLNPTSTMTANLKHQQNSARTQERAKNGPRTSQEGDRA